MTAIDTPAQPERTSRIRVLSQRGQVLVIAAGILTVLIALVGLIVDLGWYQSQVLSVQRSADAAALALIAREDENQVITETGDGGLDLSLGSIADADHGNNGSDADDDANDDGPAALRRNRDSLRMTAAARYRDRRDSAHSTAPRGK